ncbi:hypothetical protein FKW77_002535 [Venturia effusa]|uniref:Uncharacterized protein n=1 Tax=Venturia effusa TaxID=50376 RepID=A0A517LGR0_9PEZI|nr:hypothetical protein FKW77_002535 [Venturia effusa]
MKRKFTFALPPLKIPSSRADSRALKEALNSTVDFGDSPVSPPLSPFIYRRPLDSRTERELRNACAEIVKENEEPEQELNFQPLNATKAIAPKEPAAAVPNQIRAHSTANAQSSQPSSQHLVRQSSKPDTRHRGDASKSFSDQHVSQSNVRRHREPSHESFNREGQAFLPRQDSVSTRTNDVMNPLSMSPPDCSKTAPFDSMSDMSSVTPNTASTDQHFKCASTALTSAELTPSGISERASQTLLDNDAYRAAHQQADIEAAAWMRQELEKRRQQAQSTHAPQPPPSRSSARGWINEVREFVRPGSSSGTRPGSSSGRPATSSSQSRTSLSHDRQGSGSFRSSSAQGWRSWNGLRRKSSKSSFSDFNGDENGRGRSEHIDDGPNLNKGLPSLPSLDTWKDPKTQPKHGNGQHISTLIKRSKSKNKVPKSSSVPQKSPPLAVKVDRHMRMAEPVMSVPKAVPQKRACDNIPYADSSPSPPSRTMPIAKSQVRRIPTLAEDHRAPAMRAHHSKTSSTDSCFSPASLSSIGAHQNVDTRRAAQRLVKQDSNVDLNKVSERLETHQRMQKTKSYTKSATSSSQQRPLSNSTSQTRTTTEDGRALSYRRQTSTDKPLDAPFANKAEITALPVMPSKNKSNSRLRRVLSKLEITNKSNRHPKSWMDAFFTKVDAPFYQVAACKAHSTLEINLKTRCGPCRFAAVKRKYDREMAKIRAEASMMGVRGTALENLLEGLKEEKAKEEWACRTMYPPEGKRGPILKVQLRVRDVLGESPLRNELRPEDIEEMEEVNWNEIMDDFDVDFTDTHIGIPSLQTSDTHMKDESLHDSGYSSADADESDEDTPGLVVWDSEFPDIPPFPTEEVEYDWNNGEQTCAEDEGVNQLHRAGVCTIVDAVGKVYPMLEVGQEAILVW